MKHINIPVIAILLLLLLQFPALAQYERVDKADKLNYTAPNPYETIHIKTKDGNNVKNVVLMIGDGMGLTQISAAWIANRGKLNLDQMPVNGIARTYAANKLITDSGAAGTAMATGQKANYHSIGVDRNGNPVPSLIDLASEKGLSTGIVVTCGLTDATPATFCTSSLDRDLEYEIAADYLNCSADYILGGGRNKFHNREDGRSILDEMAAKGYQIAQTWEQAKKVNNGKLLAVLEEGQLPLYPERETVFQEASLHALKILSKNKNGFFAMLEGSRIDDCGHWHDIPKLVQEIFDFDQTIGKVLQWAEQDGETLVIVLADHETGGLTLLDGDIESGYVSGHFSTGGHSGILVPVYAYGPGSESFSGVFENTDVFHKIVELLQLK